MTSHRTHRQLFQDSAEAPIVPDKVIAVNAKIYKQFVLAQKLDDDMLALIRHLFEDCIGGLAIVVQDHEEHSRLNLAHDIQRFLPGITGLLNPSPNQHSTLSYLNDGRRWRHDTGEID